MGKNVEKREKAISFERLRKITETPSARIHFVGVGGVSMYSLARLALFSGAEVTGSDREDSDRVKRLRECGVRVHIGHTPDAVRGASLVVYTHAIREDNPELVCARELGIACVSRAEYMGAIMMGFTNRIGVSGSHGKSTTVAMLDAIFTKAMCVPTVLSGAELSLGEPIKIGERGVMIYEACEYKDSFLRFSPTISIGLNLELDHTDYFESITDMKDSFKKALGKATRLCIVCGDDNRLRSIRNTIKCPTVTYGQSGNDDYTYSITSFREYGFEFSVSRRGVDIGNFELNLPGAFNVSNAMAAIVCALEFGIDKDVIFEAVKSFSGIPRRLERVGTRLGREVYYDYAHHPTEIAASIAALKMISRDHTLTVIFKPHTYSRTASMWDEFRTALSLADSVILTPIYPAREEAIPNVTSERLAADIGARAVFREDDEVTGYLDLSTHGTIVIMGAGDMEKIKRSVLGFIF